MAGQFESCINLALFRLQKSFWPLSLSRRNYNLVIFNDRLMSETLSLSDGEDGLEDSVPSSLMSKPSVRVGKPSISVHAVPSSHRVPSQSSHGTINISNSSSKLCTSLTVTPHKLAAAAAVGRSPLSTTSGKYPWCLVVVDPV